MLSRRPGPSAPAELARLARWALAALWGEEANTKMEQQCLWVRPKLGGGNNGVNRLVAGQSGMTARTGCAPHLDRSEIVSFSLDYFSFALHSSEASGVQMMKNTSTVLRHGWRVQDALYLVPPRAFWTLCISAPLLASATHRTGRLSYQPYCFCADSLLGW